jgi:hypothetical protein
MRNIDDRSVTLCLTSAGRPDLLQKTLSTLLAANASSFQDIIIIDDLASAQCAQVVRELCPGANLLLNETRLGHHRSVDRMYRLVRTPFIFHCEDDWQFAPIPMIADCFKALLAIRDGSVICVREFDDLHPDLLKEAELVEIEGSLFWICSITARPIWNGFTFNPALLRRALWEEHGPHENYPTEAAISEHMKSHGLRIVQLVSGTCRHIGAHRHVYDPFQGKIGSNIR